MPYKCKAMFEQMLYADTLRGDDSTGVFGVNKYGNLKMIKSATPGCDFIQTKTYQDFSDKIFSTYNVLVGHNRAATKGAKTDQNAHPFIEENICLVHNGTLPSHKHLADVEVDSHAICKAIAKRGMDDALPDVNGAFALIWYDAKEKQLHITRNDQRPLWILEDDSAFFIASEPMMLRWLYARNFNKDIAPKFFAVGSIYTWNIDDLKEGYTNKDFPKKASSIQYLPAKPKTTNEAGSTLLSQVGSIKQTNYKQGQRIVFSHDRNSIMNNRVSFYGVSFDEHQHAVQGSLDVTGLSITEIEQLMDRTEYLSGEFFATHVAKGITKYLVSNVRATQIYQTVNNEFLTEEEIASAGNACHSCGKVLDLDEEDGKFWARIRGGIIKKLMCSDCTDEHPKLGESQCKTTNESSSSLTKQDQDLLDGYGLGYNSFYNNLC